MNLIIITENENIKDKIEKNNFIFFNKTYILKINKVVYDDISKTEEVGQELIQKVIDDYILKEKGKEFKIYLDPELPEPFKSFLYNQLHYTTFVFSIYENNRFKKWLTY